MSELRIPIGTGPTKGKATNKNAEIYLDKTKGRMTVVINGTSYDLETITNLVTAISGSSTNAQYPSAKLLYDQLALKVTGTPGVKVHRTLLTQSSTNAPSAVVLENSLGETVAWTRDSEGTYFGTLAGAFPENKCFFLSQLNDPASGTISVSRVSDNVIAVQSVTPAATPLKADGLLNLASIQVLVYP